MKKKDEEETEAATREKVRNVRENLGNRHIGV